MNARKKSTVCTIALPGGTRTTAASSGECSPIRTSGRSTGCSPPNARDSTVAPTLAPHPPQRMAIADNACAASSPSSRTAEACAGAASCIAGNSLNRRMKRRSIQSFQRQTQAPWKCNPPREATAYLSPVLIRANQWRCARYARNGRPSTARRRFSASGGPWRTANTPAFSRGWPTIAAMSPAAKTSGSVTVCSVSFTSMKPASSSTRPVSRSQGAPDARVTHTTSSALTACPSTVWSWPASTRSTRAFRCSWTPRSRSTASKASRTAPLCVGRMALPESSRWKCRSCGSRPAARNSLRSRYCMASVSSTPPAPAPTTAIFIAPGWRTTRSSSASQRWLKAWMGLTGMACSAAPATLASIGVEPMLIDNRS